MGKYRVNIGIHCDGRRNFTAGEIVESEFNLAKQFANKFTRVSELIPSNRGHEPREAPRDPTIPTPVDGDEEEVTDGPETPRPAPEAPKGPALGTIKTKKIISSKTAAATARGADVTNKFPDVAVEGFVVTQRNNSFHIYKGDDITPINASGLKKEDVAPYFKKFMED